MIIGYEVVNFVSRYVIKVIEIISSLSRQLNKTGLPVLPVQVGWVNIPTGNFQQDLLQGNHDVYLADQFPGVGDEEGWVDVYQVKSGGGLVLLRLYWTQ